MNTLTALYSGNGLVVLSREYNSGNLVAHIQTSYIPNSELLTYVIDEDKASMASFINKRIHWRRVTDIEKCSIKEYSVLFTARFSRDFIIADSISIKKDVKTELIIKLRMEYLYKTAYYWNYCNTLERKLKTKLFNTVTWDTWCNRRKNTGVNYLKFADLPKWVREIIEFYDPSHSGEYKLSDHLLIDNRSTCHNSSGWGFILGKSRINYTMISGSVIHNSCSVKSRIDSSTVVGSRLTSSIVYKCLIENCKRVTRSEVRDSIIKECAVNSSEINYSLVYNSIYKDSTTTNSFFKVIDLVPDPVINKWDLADGIINDIKSFRSIGRMYRSKVLTSKVSDYTCKEANRLKRYGLEDFICGLEIEAIAKQKILYKPSYCRVKPDGSLNYGGLEIVTRPDSPDSHVRNLGRMFRINKLSVDRSCGMHVHVPKGVGNAEIIRERIYNNPKKYYSIAGRSENAYCFYKRGCGRYQAVNVTTRTIEFRLFSGTLNIHKIKRRLQWIRKICEWSKKQTLTSKRLCQIRKEKRLNEQAFLW